MTSDPKKYFNEIKDWAIMIAAIVVVLVTVMDRFSGPSEKNASDISDLKTHQAVLDSEHANYRENWEMASKRLEKIDDLAKQVAWIRGALESINIKPKALEISTPPQP